MNERLPEDEFAEWQRSKLYALRYRMDCLERYAQEGSENHPESLVNDYNWSTDRYDFSRRALDEFETSLAQLERINSIEGSKLRERYLAVKEGVRTKLGVYVSHQLRFLIFTYYLVASNPEHWLRERDREKGREAAIRMAMDDYMNLVHDIDATKRLGIDVAEFRSALPQVRARLDSFCRHLDNPQMVSQRIVSIEAGSSDDRTAHHSITADVPTAKGSIAEAVQRVIINLPDYTSTHTGHTAVLSTRATVASSKPDIAARSEHKVIVRDSSTPLLLIEKGRELHAEISRLARTVKIEPDEEQVSRGLLGRIFGSKIKPEKPWSFNELVTKFKEGTLDRRLFILFAANCDLRGYADGHSEINSEMAARIVAEKLIAIGKSGIVYKQKEERSSLVITNALTSSYDLSDDGKSPQVRYQDSIYNTRWTTPKILERACHDIFDRLLSQEKDLIGEKGQPIRDLFIRHILPTLNIVN